WHAGPRASRHSRAGGNPAPGQSWTPTFVGVTKVCAGGNPAPGRPPYEGLRQAVPVDRPRVGPEDGSMIPILDDERQSEALRPPMSEAVRQAVEGAIPFSGSR